MSEYFKNFAHQLKELEKLCTSREELNERIEKVRTLLAANYDLMNEKEKAACVDALERVNRSEQNLTQSIKRALTQAGREYLTPSQIRDQLVRSRYDFSRYQSNPLVSIHSTLKRIKDEVEDVTLEEGTKAYRFRRDAARNITSR
jgi:hypothetical protein